MNFRYGVAPSSASIIACNLAGMLLIKLSNPSGGLDSQTAFNHASKTAIFPTLPYASPNLVSASIQSAPTRFRSGDRTGHRRVSKLFKFGTELHTLSVQALHPQPLSPRHSSQHCCQKGTRGLHDFYNRWRNRSSHHWVPLPNRI